MKEKYLFIITFFIIFIGFIFYKLKYNYIYISRKKHYTKNYLNLKLNPNSNIIKVENRIYYNKSFGLNYMDMCQKKYLMEFNRKIPDLNSNILITLIFLYPNPFQKLKSSLLNYINIISKEIDFNFSLAIITCNNDISKLIIRNSDKMKLKFISKFTLNNIQIPNSECFSFVTHSNNKIIDIFYTNTKYSNFSKTFLAKTHYTLVNRRKFTGYYAAGTNFYAYVPSHISLFDFFDFFIKFDYDLISKLIYKPSFDPFPLYKMIRNQNYFFFGCKLNFDNPSVINNLYKTFYMYNLKQFDKCNYTVLPTKFYQYKESINAPGGLNICWLGFYSMLEIRLFSEEYLSSSYGLYKNRWGDQQFFIPILYGFNFSKYSYINKNTYLCSWYKKKN